VRYRFIAENVGQYPLKKMCKAFKVSHQGYYRWRKRAPIRAARDSLDAELILKLRIAFVISRQLYGRFRLTKELKSEGYKVNHKRVSRLMKLAGIRPKTVRKFKATTNSKHKLPVADNLLKRKFSATQPNTKWVGDITYIQTLQGWLYLAVVLDLYSRKIVGWSMSDRLDTTLVVDAFKFAVSTRGKADGSAICHFDRGSQYASKEFKELVEDSGFKLSMSRKGNCWDNAVSESFFHSLKVEELYNHTFRTRDEARRIIFDYIELFYNRNRRHSAIGYLAPDEFEKLTA
jgi:putative transposase